jgi:energy-coupling factor transporter transmembrane protein EcfT
MGSLGPGHQGTGALGPGPRAFFYFMLIFYFGGSSFFSQKIKKKHCFLSVFSLILSFFLSFSVHTLWVLLSLINFTKVSCEGKQKKGVAYQL